MTIFIDTAVVMYAGGIEHPLRDPSRRVIRRVGTGDIDGVISAEVILEILHRFVSIRRPDVGRAQATEAMDIFAPVLPITHALMRRVPDLAIKYPRLSARDLVHVATCIHEGITDIISPDRAFDQVHELRRIDPSTFAAGPPAEPA
ncbi:MAG: type II toxin-antitoxin system VapC family toxin [Candidatus Limnocylindrales bacterium]